jgi:Abnormal spindle-like microcephaly-assoc'd, ASPM-SPD-2-Hydin
MKFTNGIRCLVRTKSAFAFIVLAAFLFPSKNAAGQITLTNVTSCGPTSFPTSCTIPSTGSGHLLVIGFTGGIGSNAVVSSVTDNAGNTYAEAGAAEASVSSDGLTSDIWYVADSSAGATSVTITASPQGSQAAAVIWEFSGISTTLPVDQTAVLNNQPASTTPSGASVTTTAADEVILSIAPVYHSITGIYQDNPFTEDSSIWANGWAHLITSTTGTYTAQWNQSPSGVYCASTASFKATTSSSYSVALSWTASTSSGVAGYNAYRGNVSGGPYTKLNSSLISGTSYTDSTVASGQTYYYVTVAVSSSGVQSSYSNQASATVGTTTTYLLSAAPASLSFGNVTVGSQSVLPIVLTNTGTGAVTISQDSVTGGGFSGSGLSLPVTLSAGQNTDLSITFAPSAGGSVTGSVSVVSTASDSPASVSLSGTGVHDVALTWTASTSSGVTGYNIYRGTVSVGPYTQLNSSLVAGTTYTDSTVEAGQTYYYVATAVNSTKAQSEYSKQASATVPTP